METVKTPRGTFKVRFESLEHAKKEGFSFWFTHGCWQIVGNGTSAYAVETMVERSASGKTISINDFCTIAQQ